MSTLVQRRQQLLNQIEEVDRLRRGYLSTQYLKPRQSGDKAQLGPYYILQHIRQGRKFSERIASEDVASVRADVAAWKRYQELTQELAEVTEKITVEKGEDSDLKKSAKLLRMRDWRRRGNS